MSRGAQGPATQVPEATRAQGLDVEQPLGPVDTGLCLSVGKGRCRG